MKKYLLLVIGVLFLSLPGLVLASDEESKPGPLVRFFNKKTDYVNEFYAYDENAEYGVNAVSGDFDGDGKPEVITAPQKGGGPQLKMFNWKGDLLRPGWFAFDENFRGGVNLAKGDVNGDGAQDLIVSQASEGPAWVKVYTFTPREINLHSEFLAYAEGFKGGCYVAAGNVMGNKKAEIITGAGAGGGPQVRIFGGKGKWKQKQWFAFDESFRGGVTVAAGNLNKKKKAEIVVGQASQGQAWIKIYKKRGTELISQFKAYPDEMDEGVTISIGKVKKNKKRKIITGPGGGWGPEVKVFGKKGKQVKDFAVYDSDFRGKVNASFDINRRLYMTTFASTKRIIKGPKMAITFDDGYHTGSLWKILETLERHNVKATFFLLGDYVSKHPSDFEAIKNAGHELGNHSWSHPFFPGISDSQIRSELQSTQDLMTDLGANPKPLFRFPYGAYDARTVAAVEAMGYNYYQWSAVAPQGSYQDAINGALANMKDGGIILSHVGYSNVASALDEIITRIQAAGYNLVTISEL